MFRYLLALHLFVASTVAPWMCCCTSAQRAAVVEAVSSSHSCCQHRRSSEAERGRESSSESKPVSTPERECPCSHGTPPAILAHASQFEPGWDWSAAFPPFVRPDAIPVESLVTKAIGVPHRGLPSLLAGRALLTSYCVWRC